MNHLLELDTRHREYLLEEFLFEIHLDHSINEQEQRLLQEFAEVLEINESRCKELEEKVLSLSHFETEHLDLNWDRYIQNCHDFLKSEYPPDRLLKVFETLYSLSGQENYTAEGLSKQFKTLGTKSHQTCFTNQPNTLTQYRHDTLKDYHRVVRKQEKRNFASKLKFASEVSPWAIFLVCILVAGNYPSQLSTFGLAALLCPLLSFAAKVVPLRFYEMMSPTRLPTERNLLANQSNLEDLKLPELTHRLNSVKELETKRLAIRKELERVTGLNELERSRGRASFHVSKSSNEASFTNFSLFQMSREIPAHTFSKLVNQIHEFICSHLLLIGPTRISYLTELIPLDPIETHEILKLMHFQEFISEEMDLEMGEWIIYPSSKLKLSYESRNDIEKHSLKELEW